MRQYMNAFLIIGAIALIGGAGMLIGMLFMFLLGV